MKNVHYGRVETEGPLDLVCDDVASKSPVPVPVDLTELDESVPVRFGLDAAPPRDHGRAPPDSHETNRAVDADLPNDALAWLFE